MKCNAYLKDKLRSIVIRIYIVIVLLHTILILKPDHYFLRNIFARKV